MQFRHLVALTSLAALGTLAPASLRAQGSPGRQSQHLVTAVVPSIVKMVVDPVARNVDGSPVLRVVTNDPAIRARYAGGVPAVVIRRGDVATDLTVHSKGGGDLEPEAGIEVRRSTIVAP
ncbi:MAG TPA: hypothetical protein VG712_06180 [Gemmatimonadales bacterium]|nr:hypothetical protein [Gemmatimonadales bacterium]